MRKSVAFTFITIMISWHLVGCSHRPPVFQVSNQVLAASDQEVAARLRGHVEALAGQIGPRNIYQPEELRKAEKYVENEFLSMGLKVRRQEYQAFGSDTVNLIAHSDRFDPSVPTLLVGAHYDSSGKTPGADDNASGVAVLLEMARLIAQQHPDQLTNTLFVAFSTEEPPAFNSPSMGSRVFASALDELGYNIEAALVLEMVGYFDHRPGTQHVPIDVNIDGIPSTGSFIAMVGNWKSEELAGRILDRYNSSPSRLPALPIVFPSIDWRVAQLARLSDNSSFWDVGIPALMITDTSSLRNPHYHRRSDTPDKLSYPAMEHLVTGLVYAIGR